MEGSINRVYVDFEPLSERVQEEDSETLLLFLPGFKKEQLRIQLTTTKKLRISGQRPLGDEKWSRFEKDYPTSANCDASNISAKFENAILYVKQPKLITSTKEEDQAINPNIVASKPQNPTDQPQPPKNVQQQSNQEANQTNGSTKNVPEKAIENKEPNDAKSYSENASERGKAREEEKIRDFPSEEGKSTGKTSEKHEKGNSSTVEGSESKQENASEREKAQGKEKILDFPSSEKGKSTGKTSEKHEKMDGGNQNCETKQENCKQGVVGDLATKMKTSTSKLMNLVVLVLMATVLGIYVKDWIRSGKKDEN